MEQHSYGFLKYLNGVWDQKSEGCIEAHSHHDAARLIAGEGLTLVASTRIRRPAFLVAKVWDGGGFYYVYRHPLQSEAA